MAKSMTRSELITNIATECDLSKKQVGEVFESLNKQIAVSLKNSGDFQFPGLFKITKRVVAAKPAKFGVPNPFKPGETMDVKAKPESTKLKIRPLKGLKDLS